VRINTCCNLLARMCSQARTVMIANISPSSVSVEHTLNTLRYADRVKGAPCCSCCASPTDSPGPSSAQQPCSSAGWVPGCCPLLFVGMCACCLPGDHTSRQLSGSKAAASKAGVKNRAGRVLSWALAPPSAELRKDKAERTPGGVTPGNNPAYHAAVERAHQPDGAMAMARDRSPLKDVKLNRVRPPTPPFDPAPQVRWDVRRGF